MFLTGDGRRLDRHGAGRIVRKVARRAGIGKTVTPHTLRHAFITASLDAGVPLRDVQAAASHADPRTTIRYDRARGSLGPARDLYHGRLRRWHRPVIREGWALFHLTAMTVRRNAKAVNVTDRSFNLSATRRSVRFCRCDQGGRPGHRCGRSVRVWAVANWP